MPSLFCSPPQHQAYSKHSRNAYELSETDWVDGRVREWLSEWMDEWVTRWVCRLRTHVYLAFLKQGFYILKLTGLSIGFQRARRRVSIGFHTTNEWAVAAEFPEINFMAQTTLQPHPTVDSGCLSGEGTYRDLAFLTWCLAPRASCSQSTFAFLCKQ